MRLACAAPVGQDPVAGRPPRVDDFSQLGSKAPAQDVGDGLIGYVGIERRP